MGTKVAGSIIRAAETEPIGRAEEEALELLHMRARVEHDGKSATLTINTQDGPIDLALSFPRMRQAFAEIREAGDTMLRRQLRRPDDGRTAFQDLIRAAPIPTAISTMVDPRTGDCIQIYRFEDRLPYAIRTTMEQVRAARDDLSLDIKRYAN